MQREMSLAVVGIDYPNHDAAKSNRRFEMMLCSRGEPVQLVPEPKNKHDPNAIAVISARGIQLGYLTWERALFIGGLLRAGETHEAVFQETASKAAIIRARFGGGRLTLPIERPDVVYDRREMVYGEEVDWGC